MFPFSLSLPPSHWVCVNICTSVFMLMPFIVDVTSTCSCSYSFCNGSNSSKIYSDGINSVHFTWNRLNQHKYFLMSQFFFPWTNFGFFPFHNDAFSTQNIFALIMLTEKCLLVQNVVRQTLFTTLMNWNNRVHWYA